MVDVFGNFVFGVVVIFSLFGVGVLVILVMVLGSIDVFG